jgi:magnesium-transporting ATPase (P-type)
MHFNMKVFWAWVFSSIYHGTLIFFLSFMTVNETSTGLTYDMAQRSTVAFSMIMHTTTFKLLISLNHTSPQVILVSVACLVAFYVILAIMGLPALAAATGYEYVHLATDIFSNTSNVLTIMFGSMLPIGLDYGI